MAPERGKRSLEGETLTFKGEGLSPLSSLRLLCQAPETLGCVSLRHSV